MNEGDITITITESQHELMIEIINHALDAMHFAMPYGASSYDIPLENEIVQRWEMTENMRDMFLQLWSDRFNDDPVEEVAQGHVRKDLDSL